MTHLRLGVGCGTTQPLSFPCKLIPTVCGRPKGNVTGCEGKTGVAESLCGRAGSEWRGDSRPSPAQAATPPRHGQKTKYDPNPKRITGAGDRTMRPWAMPGQTPPYSLIHEMSD